MQIGFRAVRRTFASSSRGVKKRLKARAQPYRSRDRIAAKESLLAKVVSRNGRGISSPRAFTAR